MKIFTSLAGGLVFTALFCILVVSYVNGENEINSMRYLGQVEGKGFFAEMLPRRTWFEARQACKDFGMQQVSLMSKTQTQFLNGNHDSNHFTGWFWTSGRESHSFIWDTNNLTVSNHGMYFNPPSSPTQNCVSFSPINFLHTSDCTKKMGTLCEIDQSLS